MAQYCCDRDRTTWLDMHSNSKMAPNFKMAQNSKWPQTSKFPKFSKKKFYFILYWARMDNFEFSTSVKWNILKFGAILKFVCISIHVVFSLSKQFWAILRYSSYNFSKNTRYTWYIAICNFSACMVPTPRGTRNIIPLSPTIKIDDKSSVRSLSRQGSPIGNRHSTLKLLWYLQ